MFCPIDLTVNVTVRRSGESTVTIARWWLNPKCLVSPAEKYENGQNIDEMLNFCEIGWVLPPCTYALKIWSFYRKLAICVLPYFEPRWSNFFINGLFGFLIKFAFKWISWKGHSMHFLLSLCVNILHVRHRRQLHLIRYPNYYVSGFCHLDWVCRKC